MTRQREHEKETIGEELKPIREEARERVEELGLNPRPVKYWINHNDEVNQLASYGGFQHRYPHWRWGMKYDRQQKENEYGGGKIFEMVINNDPCHAYLQMSNKDIDQKAVITHVEAHSDFFANNEWFQDNPKAVDMLARNAEKIEEYMNDPEIEREEVEQWIDMILCIEDNINQYSEYKFRQGIREEDKPDDEDVDALDNLEIDERVEQEVFDESFFEEDKECESIYEDTTEDILAFLIHEGMQFNEHTDKAEEFEEWQVDVLDMLREEFYYFSPQKMTSVMNEGWASYIESMIMTDEEFADDDEIVDYADQHSKVLQSPGFNPYKLGKELWQHIENTVNRKEVVDKLLRIEGVNPDNFQRKIDFQEVYDELCDYESDDVIVRNYSLTRPNNQGFIQKVSLDELRKYNRYIIERERYQSISEAIEDVDYHKGWNRMRQVRETHNDVMFIDEFLTQQFVDEENYFTHEHRVVDEENQIASRDVEDVKKKLLLKLTNFGKPTIEVVTGNYNNSGELLLLHKYNGVVLDFDKLEDVIENIHSMWGRPVNIATVGKLIPEDVLDNSYAEGHEPEPEEMPVVFRYDGSKFEDSPVEEGDVLYDKLMAEDLDYSTKPDEWLA